MIAAPFTKVVSFIIPTVEGNICPFAILSDWPWQGLNPQSVALVTPMTMPWLKRINGLYKAEVIHRRGPWKTMAAVEWETLKCVDWFNNRRLLEPIGYIPPAEAEEEVLCTVQHIRYGRMT